MISVEHNYRSVNQALSSVLLNRCNRSPMDYLQGRPICACGFKLGETTPFIPLKEIEKQIDLGILETLNALRSTAMQEKILPYLEGLDLVNRKKQASEIRRFLGLERDSKNFMDQLDQTLTSQVIRDINEAFHGKVVVVKRDIDQLYRSLVHRRYSLAQFRKIIQDWLKEETIGEDTFLHFVGKGEGGSADGLKEEFEGFLEDGFRHLVPLFQETGHGPFIKAMIAALWAAEYGLPGKKITGIFPFLERGTEEETGPWTAHLKELALALRSEKRDLFESFASEAGQDSALIHALWSLLSSLSPVEVFRRETVFVPLLKEAFERVLCGKLEAGLVDRIATPPAEAAFEEDYGFSRQRHEMVESLRSCVLFMEKVADLKAVRDPMPETFGKWESLYVRSVASVSYLKERLLLDFKRIGTAIPSFLKEEEGAIVKKIQELSGFFADFYCRNLPRWEKGEGPSPMMIDDIPFIISKKRNIPEHNQVRYVLMDGMRWDLWEYIKADFFGKRPNLFRFVREGGLWANRPTSTAPQLERFEKAFHSAYPDTGHENFWKISGMDEKVHSEKGPLTQLFANITAYLEMDFLFRLRNLPPRTLLILFSDHGFVENPAFRPGDKYDTARYTHGKDSPFEVIVPWAWVMRI